MPTPVYTIPAGTYPNWTLATDIHFTDDFSQLGWYRSSRTSYYTVYKNDSEIPVYYFIYSRTDGDVAVSFASPQPTSITLVRVRDSATFTYNLTLNSDYPNPFYSYRLSVGGGNDVSDIVPQSVFNPSIVSSYNESIFWDQMNYLMVWGGYVPHPPPIDPYAGGASAGTTGGGDGTADDSEDMGSEVVPEPSEPTVSAVATGFLSLWTGTESQIQDIASFLWNDLANVQDVLNALIRIVADPMKLIIGLSIVPSQGLHKGASSPVTVGPFLTGLNLTKLTSQYFTVDCGSLSFDTVCGNTFLDYAPYSKFSIYLPYIGTRTVDANDFVGHTISVKYKGDALTGNCVAFILKDNSVMYQFAGSLSSNCPLSSNDWTQTIISAVQMAATGIAMASTGGAAAPAAAAMGAGEASSLSSLALNAASNISGNVSQLAPQVMKSGAVSGASGLLGVQVPYIIREAVSYQDTTEFNTLGGYPSNIYSLLSDLTGYTEVQSIHLTGMTCTQAEMDEIEQLLKQGVII